MKIIFLDIDGVLNTDKWEAHMLSQRLPMEDEFGIFFDKEAINNLAKIITVTKAQIVIHSTWKLGKTIDWLQLLWKKRSLPGNIAGITPDIPPFYSKMDEIATWLADNPYISNYVILDDEDEFSSYQCQHLIRVDSAIGITEDNANEAIRILSKN